MALAADAVRRSGQCPEGVGAGAKRRIALFHRLVGEVGLLEVALEPHPDGYVVVLASPDGSAGPFP